MVEDVEGFGAESQFQPMALLPEKPDIPNFEHLHPRETEMVVGMEELASTVPDRSQPVHNGLHNNLISLVEDCRSRADEAEIRPAGEAAGFKNLRQCAKSIVRSYRMRPADFLNACTDHSSAHNDRFDAKSHTIAAVSHPEAVRPLKNEFLPAASSM